jgi:hypothetical protein
MLILADLIPYAGPASDALASLAPLWRARRAVAQGRFDDAQREAQEAAARDPRSPRPWRLHGKWLAEADQPLRAAEAYARAARYFRNGWLAAFVPPLLRDAGRTESASTRPVVRPKVPVNGSEWDVLEAAWRELLAPRTDCVWLGQDDTGAVRDFFSPVKGGRWTRHEARVRLRPARLTGSDPLVIVMGAPPPVPFDAPIVTVHVSGGETARFALGRRAGVFHMTAATTPGTPVEIEIEAPTWTRPGRPAEQGVLVARVCVGAEAARAVDVALR